MKMKTACSFQKSGSDYMRTCKLETQIAEIVLFEKLGAGNSRVLAKPGKYISYTL
jgi:hypothetical protein